MEQHEIVFKLISKVKFMKNAIIFMSIAVLITACAKRPDAISPVSMGNAFQETSCNKAQLLLNEERINLAALSVAQNSAATGDAFTVFLVGVPASAVTGSDKEGDIATSKGKVIALENRLLSC